MHTRTSNLHGKLSNKEIAFLNEISNKIEATDLGVLKVFAASGGNCNKLDKARFNPTQPDYAPNCNICPLYKWIGVVSMHSCNFMRILTVASYVVNKIEDTVNKEILN